jgi:hypothetical protein
MSLNLKLALRALLTTLFFWHEPKNECVLSSRFKRGAT